MKTILIFLSLILAQQAFSLEKHIVVLSSINNPEINPFWRRNYEIEDDIQQRFERHFNGSGYKVIYQHGATASTLHHHLISPHTLALFWISHAKASQSVFSGLIVDKYGNNLESVFQMINPNIKYIGLIGCQAQELVKIRNSSTFIYSFDKKITLGAGIRRAIKESAKFLDSDPVSFMKKPTGPRKTRSERLTLNGKPELNFQNELKPFLPSQGIMISIHNTNPRHFAILTVKEHFIGILMPSPTPQQFILPEESFIGERYKLKVEYQKGDYSSSVEMPLAIEVPDNHQVKSLNKADGSLYLIGQNHFYYISKK